MRIRTEIDLNTSNPMHQTYDLLNYCLNCRSFEPVSNNKNAFSEFELHLNDENLQEACES